MLSFGFPGVALGAKKVIVEKVLRPLAAMPWHARRTLWARTRSLMSGLGSGVSELAKTVAVTCF